MIIKSFFRKKIFKIYLFLITIMLTSLSLLFSAINYYTNTRNELFSNYSELIILNDKDIYPEIEKTKNIENLQKTLFFKINKDYKVFQNQSYQIYDSNGNIVESKEYDDENKMYWSILETENLRNYILVYKAEDYDMKLDYDEIVIGILDFYYEIYPKEIINNMKSEKIGFYFDEKNFEFKIKDVISTETSILIISNEKYNELKKLNKVYGYTAKVKSYEAQNEIKENLSKYISNNGLVSVSTFYKNNASDEMNYLYHLLDTIKTLAYFAIIIFAIVLLIILKNILNDFKKNVVLYRKLGFSNNKIKIEIFKLMFLTYMLSLILMFILYIFLALIINTIFHINLYNLNYLFTLKMIFGGLLIILLNTLFKFYHLKI